MALICRRCGVELVEPKPYHYTAQQLDEMGIDPDRGDGIGVKPGWRVDPATDVIWDEAVCLEGMNEAWMRKVNDPGYPSDKLMHVPVRVDILGWSECDGKGDDGKVSGAVEVRQRSSGEERRD